MNIDVIAAQIRTAAPLFNGNVAGAAAYANGVANQVWLPTPAAYVVPLDQDAGENTSSTGLWQDVHERIGVIVVLDTLAAGGALDLADRRGQAAAASLDAVRAALFAAILNWRPDWTPSNPSGLRETRGIYYIGGGYPDAAAFDLARYFYEFRFGLDTTISDLDGWQPPSMPLGRVNITASDQISGETLVTAAVILTP